MNNFTLMILAAGFGRRMKNLTKNTPKPLLSVHDETMLSNNINFFLELGCQKIIINTHYLYKKINDYIESKYSNKNIILIYEKKILDTGGGVKNALKYFEGKNFLVSNVDIFWNKNNKKDIENFISKINKVDSCLLLLAKENNSIGFNKKNGDFAFQNNYLRRWKKNDPTIYYSGLQILNPKVFKDIKEIKFSMNNIWDNLIIKNKLYGVFMKSNLFHLGDINSYNKIISNTYLIKK